MTGEPTLIYETVHGSTAYGLARAGSDVDLKGVVIGPARWYLGWRGGPEQIDLGPDHVRYDVRKFFRLAADGNPTVLELLWTDPVHHRTVTPIGSRLLAARDQFLSRRVAERFGRYALGQMKRIQTHRTWLLDPPAASPRRGDFGLPEHATNPRENEAERRYAAAQKRWREYTDWREHRNPARSVLEARHGYDTKHAMHLVRLQRMAVEILTAGEVHVTRADRDELLAVRDGAWSFEELTQRADEMAAAIESAATTSPLPEHPDLDALDALCAELVQSQLRA